MGQVIGDRERAVWLGETGHAASLVTRRGVKPNEPPVSCEAGRRISARVVTKLVASAGRRPKVHLYPHLFRHTYATRGHELGVDPLVIQGLLGHESVATTEIYTRVSAGRGRRFRRWNWAVWLEGFQPHRGWVRN